MSFREGDKVEARYRGNARAYPGRIARVNGDGTYNVDYDDGEKERGVAADLIKLLESGGERGGSSSSTATELVTALLTAGADPDATNKAKQTLPPLYHAAGLKHERNQLKPAFTLTPTTVGRPDASANGYVARASDRVARGQGGPRRGRQ